MLRTILCCVALVGCGSSAAPPAARPRVATTSPRDAERAEQARRAKLATAHHALEEEQQAALATTCAQPPPPEPHERCEPSCYRAEAPDPRAGKKLDRAEIVHLACTPADAAAPAPILLADEVGGAQIVVRAARGPLPKPHKPGTWEAEVEAAVRTALEPEVARGDVIRVTGAWQPMAHPVTHERLRCVPVAHVTKAMRRALDACGARGTVACEAAGNAAAHGLNVVHYRLAEARALHAAGNDAGCRQAALEAIAVARGLPRWRQYVTLNVARWRAYPRYRTRFDGVLDEDTLFTTAAALGSEAEAVHAACGGAASPKTTAAQEQSFHTCW